MTRIDFVLSNRGHHLEMMLPVIRELVDDATHCRVVSLCELRGFATPKEKIRSTGAEVVTLFPSGVRRSPSSGAQRHSPFAIRLRRWTRNLVWATTVGPRLRALWSEAPHAIAVPNDAAFPYDRIATACACRGLPLVLLQEGIRFPLPAEDGRDSYGMGGAAAIAAWGEASAGFFRGRGVSEDRIFITGSPRFDREASRDQDNGRSGAVPGREGPTLSKTRLLLATNPIDDQGFCTTREKLELIDRFLDAVEPLILVEGVSLLLRWHSRESGKAYENLLSSRSWGDDVTRANDRTLAEVLGSSTAVVILASTVGLEALAAGKPLGVLEIPGWGHMFDYVTEGAATAISWEADPTASLRSLVSGASRNTKETAFLDRHLGPRVGAAEAIAQVLRRLARSA